MQAIKTALQLRIIETLEPNLLGLARADVLQCNRAHQLPELIRTEQASSRRFRMSDLVKFAAIFPPFWHLYEKIPVHLGWNKKPETQFLLTVSAEMSGGLPELLPVRSRISGSSRV